MIITDLNEYALEEILKLLSSEDLARLSCVNKLFHRLASKELLWMKHCWNISYPFIADNYFKRKERSGTHKEYYSDLLGPAINAVTPDISTKSALQKLSLSSLSVMPINDSKLEADCMNLQILHQLLIEATGVSGLRMMGEFKFFSGFSRKTYAIREYAPSKSVLLPQKVYTRLFGKKYVSTREPVNPSDRKTKREVYYHCFNLLMNHYLKDSLSRLYFSRKLEIKHLSELVFRTSCGINEIMYVYHKEFFKNDVVDPYKARDLITFALKSLWVNFSNLLSEMNVDGDFTPKVTIHEFLEDIWARFVAATPDRAQINCLQSFAKYFLLEWYNELSKHLLFGVLDHVGASENGLVVFGVDECPCVSIKASIGQSWLENKFVLFCWSQLPKTYLLLKTLDGLSAVVL